MGRLRVITNISLAFSYKALTRLFLAQAALHAGSEPTLTSSDGASVIRSTKLLLESTAPSSFARLS